MPVFFVGKDKLRGRPTEVYTVLRKDKPPVDVHVHNNVPFACCFGGVVMEDDDEALKMVREHLPEEPEEDSTEPTSFVSIGELAREAALNVAEAKAVNRVICLDEDSSWFLVFDPAGVYGLCHKESYTWSIVKLGVDNRPEFDSFAFFSRMSGPAADDDQLEARHFNKLKWHLE